MADDKDGRENQARTADRRQRTRALEEELRRSDEPEPPADEAALEAFEADLESLSFPATGADVAAAAGDHRIETPEDTSAVADLVPAVAEEVYESPSAVRTLIQRPTVASAMKRIVEANADLPNDGLPRTQRAAYEKTFRALAAVDTVDEDEVIGVVADWVVDRIREKEKLPGSREIRRQAAKECRSRGYSVSVDDWLGI